MKQMPIKKEGNSHPNYVPLQMQGKTVFNLPNRATPADARKICVFAHLRDDDSIKDLESQ